MNYIERRLERNRRDPYNGNPGIEHRTRLQRISDTHRKKDPRKADRRKHCMHCSMPYEIDLLGTRRCVCRINVLRGTP